MDSADRIINESISYTSTICMEIQQCQTWEDITHYMSAIRQIRKQANIMYEESALLERNSNANKKSDY